jgi:hypothetical protein
MHFRYEGTQGGKPFVEDATLAIRDDVTFDMDVTVSIGGEPRVVLDGTFHKAPPRPRRPRNRAPAAQAEPQAPAPQQ